ncbi:MAG: lactate utilization protein B [Bacteroidales bacterium]|nr:lactate utilization protein B [Bacteroidales bacterium]
MINHAKAAKAFLRNEKRTDWHDQALWFVRQKRDRAVNQLPEWEQLRETASQIKGATLSKLAHHLLEFERQALQNGVYVHWANDAEDFNRCVLKIIRKHNATKVVKSKSMLTEECHLNPFLECEGIEVVDTDLGERIIQFRNEPPSHIVLPAIHLKKEEIGELFHVKLGTEAGASDPTYLTHAACAHLREKFLQAEVAITGVNFAVAETGAVVVCTNEGNADMGVNAAKVQIHCMGIEKVIPRTADLAVFTRMLARSATGQAVTTYTSHYLKPVPGKEMHVIIVDNGRTDILKKPQFLNSLKCIRCGACMNTCPVYRRSGGHSYGSTIPGPIGSILAPGSDLKQYRDLPFASSLCGSCSNVCPVKINIHEQLYSWRQEVSSARLLRTGKSITMSVMAKILSNSSHYQAVGLIARRLLARLPRKMIYNSFNVWGLGRELPEPPASSFNQWYRQNRKNTKL